MKQISYSGAWKKIHFYLIFGFFIYVFLVLVNLWSGEPKYLKEAESFLRHNDDIVFQLGEIKTVNLKMSRQVFSDGKRPDYHDFKFIVRAQKQDALVTIRVQAVSLSDPALKYSVISIQPK